MNNSEKYKVKAFQISQNEWEAQYISPAKIGSLGIPETGSPERLGKKYKTEAEASKFTFDHLKDGLKIPEDNIMMWP